MKKHFLTIILVLLFSVMIDTALAQIEDGAAGVVVLKDQTRSYPLGLHVEILEDPSGQLNIDQVASPDMDSRFYPSSEEIPHFGITRSAIWIRFRVEDISNNIPNWLLQVRHATLDYVDLYLPDTAGGYRTYTSGLLMPDAQQDFPDNHYVFEIPAGLQPDQYIYLRIATTNSMILPATLWSPSAFDQKERNEALIWGVYYGILLGMVIFNGLLFLSLRDRDYLYLVLYILAVLIQTAFIDGRIKDILPSDLGYQFFYLNPLYTIPVLPALLLFSTSFLKTREFAPRLYKISLGLFVVFGLLAVSTFIINRYLVNISIVLASLVGIIVVILCGLAAWRKKYRPARYFLIAMLVPLLFGIGDPLSRLGFIPVIPWFYSVAHLGNAFLVTILSLALADRINYYQHQTKDAYEEVRKREQLITEYMDALPLGVAVYGTDARPRLVNQAALELFHLQDINPDNSLEKSIQGFNIYAGGSDKPIPADDLPVSRALAGEKSQRDDIEIEIDGKKIPLEILAKPIYDTNGSIQYAISAFQDISQRKEQEITLRVAQALYQSLVEQEVLLICRFNQEYTLTFVNQSYCDYFGKTRDELLGSDLFVVVNEPDRDAVKSELAKINPEKPTLVIENQVISCDGEVRWQRWTNQGFFDDQNNIIEYQATGEDITEQVLIEEQLTRYRENLEELVAERTSQERHQRAIAESLQLSASVLNSDLNLDNVLSKILNQLPQVIVLNNAAIFLKEGEDLVLSNATNLSQDEQDLKFPLSMKPFPAVRVFLEGKSLFVSDLGTEPNWNDWAYTFNLRSWMGTPLRSGDEVIGVLSVSSATPGLYVDADLPVLEAFANHASIAILNARLYEGSRKAAALEERNRLARDLHDSVTQTLFSASIIAQALPLQWEQDKDGARRNLSRLHQLTSGALAEMRMLLLELRLGSLEKYPLSTLMRNLCEAFQSKNNIPTDLNITGDDSLDSPTEVKEFFYRITQESLNNIAKHSKANHVKVRLEQADGEISLRIQDEGKGFDPNDVEPGHMGLQIMLERAAAINAGLQIESKPGSGTIISSEWRRLA